MVYVIEVKVADIEIYQKLKAERELVDASSSVN